MGSRPISAIDDHSCSNANPLISQPSRQNLLAGDLNTDQGWGTRYEERDPMTKVIELATGQISSTATIEIELIKAD